MRGTNASAFGRSDSFSFLTIAVEGLSRTDMAMREWMGLLAYRIAGKTDDLFPGPAGP